MKLNKIKEVFEDSEMLLFSIIIMLMLVIAFKDPNVVLDNEHLKAICDQLT